MTARPDIRLRPAEEADARLLHEWVNSPDSLAGKERTQGAIPWDGHIEWLRTRLRDPDTLLFIVEAADDAVGQVRLQPRGQAHEIDVYVVPEQRGRGLAAAALRLALQRLARRHPGRRAVARVGAGNMASQRLFLSLGFERIGGDAAGVVEFALTPAKSEAEHTA